MTQKDKEMKNDIKTGDRVKMSQELKDGLIFMDCKEHVDEFGECEGIVEDLVYGDEDDHNYNIRWIPSMLRYGYPLEMLEKVNEKKIN